MKPLIGVIVVAMLFVGVEDALARGGRIGGGGGRGSRGGARSGNRSPSMSRPSRSSSRPNVSRPSVSRPTTSRPSSSRPSVSRPNNTRPTNTRPNNTRPSVTRPNTGNPVTRPNVTRPNPGGNVRPGGKPGTRPSVRPGESGIGTGNRPSSGDLKNFLNLPQDRLPSTKPATRPGNKLGGKPNLTPGTRPSTKPGNKPGKPNKDRFPNRDKTRPKWNDHKHELGNNLRRDYRGWSNKIYHGGHWGAHYTHWGSHYNHWHFGWHNHAHGYWWRWATWPTVGAWFIGKWNQPYLYDYGNTVYYENNTVYYQDKAVATGEEYAEQAESIASDLPEDVPEDIEWMPLGVFALSPSDTAESNMVLQMAVSKEGFITGSYYNSTTESTIPIEGKVDQKTQRAAWKLSDGISPIVMETGIYNMTLDETVALVHFSSERTEEWLMVRLENPEKENSSAAESSPTPEQE